MDFKHQVFSIISEFTGQNNIITVNVTLVDFVGDLETGLFLSQMIYWSDRTKRKDGFFYKTDDEWQQEVMLSKYSVRKARKKLEEMNLLETKVMKANGNPTVHYRFNKNGFCEMFISFLRNRKNQITNSEEPSFENEISLTDITTDTTSDITTNKDISIQYAEFVKMKESEYNKLVEAHGEPLTKKMIEVLDNYKGANGKKYKSDYRAILNWVAGKVKGEKNERYKPSSRKPLSEYDQLSL